MVFGAAESLHALSVRGAGGVDVVRDGRRADEANRLDIRVCQDRVHGLLVAVDDVEDAGGQASLKEQLRQPHRHAGVALGGL